ncbi:ABC transporter permease [Terrihabitans rhizophilus]|jgi:NitT/TauT family transport system permease protein|uniref:ABC transporter permease subunit n=1 Tax=Terrihabitans rhizophilus TaxID=3092662 RepID=A0ABU4RSU9_9HYPH|nr:ABC transporter permease subunit [Terrihabitans sp. PJ23]MDX6806755.1 ABC transporter permease subunit [Terrihabitans sp. PJ23]
MTIAGYRIPPLASLLFWAVIWEIVGHLGIVFLFPPLSSVVMELGQVVGSSTFLGAAWMTVESFVLGLLLAIAVGVPMGLLMGRFNAADKLLGMWVNLFVSAPLSALVPIIMILFGMGQATIIVTVFMFAVWIIVLDTRAGVRDVPNSLNEMARSFGASGWQQLTKITLLAALPEILAGIRLGVVRGVKGVVIGQLLVSIVGLGELFELYSRNFLMEEFWALTLIVFAFALGAAELIAILERKIDFYAGVRHG